MPNTEHQTVSQALENCRLGNNYSTFGKNGERLHNNIQSMSPLKQRVTNPDNIQDQSLNIGYQRPSYISDKPAAAKIGKIVRNANDPSSRVSMNSRQNSYQSRGLSRGSDSKPALNQSATNPLNLTNQNMNNTATSYYTSNPQIIKPISNNSYHAEPMIIECNVEPDEVKQ